MKQILIDDNLVTALTNARKLLRDASPKAEVDGERRTLWFHERDKLVDDLEEILLAQ